jgi:hypothetical protein
MDKVSGANMCWLLNLLLLKARLKGCFLARIGDYLPRLRLHCSSPPLIAAPHDIHVRIHRLFRLRIQFIHDGHIIGQQQADVSPRGSSEGVRESCITMARVPEDLRIFQNTAASRR